MRGSEEDNAVCCEGSTFYDAGELPPPARYARTHWGVQCGTAIRSMTAHISAPCPRDRSPLHVRRSLPDDIDAILCGCNRALSEETSGAPR
jgi:hypothetical protein